MGIDVTVTDNSKQVLSEFDKKLDMGLNAIGVSAERYAKKQCPVDTGRLRNSITYATRSYSGRGKYLDNMQNIYNDASAKGTPEKGVVYIGTNVEYAPAVEYRDVQHHTGQAHFLKDSATQHGEEYKSLLESAMKS